MTAIIQSQRSSIIIFTPLKRGCINLSCFKVRLIPSHSRLREVNTTHTAGLEELKQKFITTVHTNVMLMYMYYVPVERWGWITQPPSTFTHQFQPTQQNNIVIPSFLIR